MAGLGPPPSLDLLNDTGMSSGVIEKVNHTPNPPCRTTIYCTYLRKSHIPARDRCTLCVRGWAVPSSCNLRAALAPPFAVPVSTYYSTYYILRTRQDPPSGPDRPVMARQPFTCMPCLSRPCRKNVAAAGSAMQNCRCSHDVMC